MARREDPFANTSEPIDVSDFAQDAKRAKRKEVDQAELAKLARATGFDRSVLPQSSGPAPPPSQAAASVPEPAVVKQRRYTTGRDTQLNVKCKPETKARFLRLADKAETSLGAMFERMVDAYEKAAADRSE